MNTFDPSETRKSGVLTSGDKQPGYFRLGIITLDVPPEDIVTTRITNADEAEPLRAKYPMFQKTGQSRWDTTIRWIALAQPDDNAVIDYSQWRDLRYIIAMVRAAPFVEVENAHLRQAYYPIDPSMEHKRLGFGLRQIRVETSPDMIGGLICTLTMTYLNYYPYTPDFGYIGSAGEAVSAYQCQAFKDYLDTWIAKNMSEPVPTDKDDFPPGPGWDNLIPGSLEFKWRLYNAVPLDQKSPTVAPKLTTSQRPVVPKGTRARTVPLSSKITQGFADKVSDISDALGIDPSWLLTVMRFETGGSMSPSVRNVSSKAVGLIQFTERTALRLGTTTARLAAMSAEDQLDYVYAYFQNYSDTMDNLGDVAMAVFAPVAIGRDDDFVLYRSPSKAYTQNSGLDHTGKGFITRGDYLSRLGTSVVSAPPAPRMLTVSSTISIGSDPAVINTATSQAAVDTAAASWSQQVSQASQALQDDGWVLDYSTEKDSFFYRENDISLTDDSHGDAENDLAIYPQALAIQIINNLVQIPLASYQYPTYQHVGPPSIMVSISLRSVGGFNPERDPADQEPIHPGIQVINDMAHTLEEQFQRMRTRWRSVLSIHRMQAVRTYNTIFNMLGVYSLLLKDVTTSTVPESPNELDVQITANQYENFFEDVGEYLVKGVQNTYQKPFFDYLENDIDKGLSDKDKKNIFQLLKYRDAKKARDQNILAKVIADNKLGTFPALGSLTNQDLIAAVLTKGQLTPIVDDPTGSGIPTNNSTDIGSKYPDYAARVRSGGGAVSVTDTLLVRGIVNDLSSEASILTIDGKDVTAAVKDALAVVGASIQADISQKDAMDQLYTLWIQKAASGPTADPLFYQQMQLVINDPKFRSAMAPVGHRKGPGVENPGHGAYRDLGVTDGNSSPADYFVDYPQADAVRDGIRAAVQASSLAGNQVNKPSSNAASVVVSDGIQADNDQFLNSVVPPQTGMKGAFPAFKLFLLEEDNTGSFYAFDDFYSYSSVLEIEILEYRDKPHLARIVLTNLSQMLTHKLFDNTVMGKHEAQLEAKFSPRIPITDSKGHILAGPGVVDNVVKDPLTGRVYMNVPGRNMVEGYGQTYNEIPLAYFPLQVGTKIEVRVGYDNNPDKLVRRFAGVVTEIEGDEILTITAQGFQGELMETAIDKVGTDQFWSLSTLVHAGFKKGPRFGGLKIWGDSGDAGTIMRKVLEVSNAKHFGHWQLLKPDSPLMRGWPWQRSLGVVLEKLGSTTIGPLLQTGSDRTGQNILINHVINQDGSIGQGTRGKRTYFSQTPWWAFDSWYHLNEDDDKNRTIWDIIQDVSRRYPEYILAVKDYGFPYGCDATLVFGHPRDSYYARPFNYDEGRNEDQLNAQASDLFREWWKSTGRELTKTAMGAADSVSPYLLSGLDLTGIPNVSGEKRPFAIVKSSDLLTRIDQQGAPAFQSIFDQVDDSTARSIGLFLNSISPNIVISQGKVDQVVREILALQRAWQSYRDAIKKTPNALLRPIRRFHYADHQSIIHNGIMLNDRIFNSVRINGKVKVANDNIPNNYRRVLDCDDAIIHPDKNVEDQNLTNAYAEWFLREEVGKMYRGELILRGQQEIAPWDVVFIADPSTGMTGPIIVDKIVHSFTRDQGYITIITPLAYITINEAASQEFVKRLAIGLSNAYKLTVAAGNEFVSADSTAQAAAFAVPAAGALTTAAVASAAGSATATVAGILPALSATPPGWLAWAVVGTLAVGGAAYILARNTELNPILISPIMRFGKPWIGGLEGYEISDFARLVKNDWANFWIDELQPTLLSFKVARGLLNNTQF